MGPSIFSPEDRKKPAINVTGTLELVSFEKKQVAKVGRHFFVGFPLPVDQSIDVFFCIKKKSASPASKKHPKTVGV